MQLDLKLISFSRRHSRHLIYEETDPGGAGWAKGLYLALASEGVSSFIGGPVTGPKGFLRITPTLGEEALEYSYSASPFIVSLTAAGGGIRFALDGAKILRIEGKGVGLRLDGKIGFGGNALLTARGAELTFGGAVYLIKALKGSITLDCRWQLKALRTSDPVIRIQPDETGAIDLAVFDTDDTYELPEPAESLDSCAEASEKDYRAFAKGLDNFGPEYSTFFSNAAYALWTGFLDFKGKDLAYSDKLGDRKICALEQPILTLPLQNAETALGIIGGMLGFASPQGLVPTWVTTRQNLFEAAPPVYAYAVSRLMVKSSLSAIPKEKLSAFYTKMSKAVRWWLTHRSEGARLCCYAYRHECGWPDERLFSCGTPAATPDLAAYLILAAEALSSIASMLGRTDEAAFWGAESKRQLDILTQTLWDGTRLTCVNALTGEPNPAEGLLSLIPLILGKRLPEAIRNALAAKAADVSWAETNLIPAALVILGLKDAGFAAEAKLAAERLIASCTAGGANDTRGKGVGAGSFFTPAACAALLCIGQNVLEKEGV